MTIFLKKGPITQDLQHGLRMRFPGIEPWYLVPVPTFSPTNLNKPDQQNTKLKGVGCLSFQIHAGISDAFTYASNQCSGSLFGLRIRMENQPRRFE